MVKQVPALLVGGIAALVLAMATTSAAARTFSSSSQTLRSTWSRLTFAGGGLTNTCDLTLEGSFHERQIAKVVNSLIGFITQASLGNCQNATSILDIPWHITYAGFTGRLPSIESTRLNVIGMAVLIDFGGLGRCLARSTAERPVQAIATIGVGSVVERFRMNETVRVPLFRRLGGLACPSEGEFIGQTNSLTVLNSITRITLTLI